MRALRSFFSGLGLSAIASAALAQGQPPQPQGQPQPMPPPTLGEQPPMPQQVPGPGARQPYPYPAPPPYPPPPQGYPQLQPAPYPYGYPPLGYYPPPPPQPPPPPDPSRYTHDGFFFQLAPGASLPMVKVSGYGAALTGKSTGAALNVAFGGTVSRGLVVAGAIDFQSTSILLSRDGTSLDRETPVRSTLTGVTVAYYPDPKKGLFVQGGGGFATMTVSGLVLQNAPSTGRARQYSEASDFDGLGVFAAVGHEWFVQEQWSFGLLARVDGLWTSSTTSLDVESRLISPSLRMTLTLH